MRRGHLLMQEKTTSFAAKLPKIVQARTSGRHEFCDQGAKVESTYFLRRFSSSLASASGLPKSVTAFTKTALTQSKPVLRLPSTPKRKLILLRMLTSSIGTR